MVKTKKTEEKKPEEKKLPNSKPMPFTRPPKKEKPEQGMLFGEADLLVQTLARLLSNTVEDIERREAAIDGAQAKLERLYSMKTDLLKAQKIAIRQRDSLSPQEEKKGIEKKEKKRMEKTEKIGKSDFPKNAKKGNEEIEKTGKEEFPKKGKREIEQIKKPKEQKGEPQRAKP